MQMTVPKESLIEHPTKVIPVHESLTFKSSIYTLTDKINCKDEQNLKQYYDSNQIQTNLEDFNKI